MIQTCSADHLKGPGLFGHFLGAQQGMVETLLAW